MAYASVTYTSASGTTFALTNSNGDPIPYIRQSDIKVYVNTVLQTLTTDYTFNTAGTAIVLNSPVSGATILLQRITDIADPTVVYTAGSTLTAQDLNNADNQIRYGLQEFQDSVDAGGGVPDGDKGDISVGGNGTIWTVDNGAITDVKVSASAAITGTKIQQGSTTDRGTVQLTDSVSSTSTTTAATPNSVKTAYDLANSASTTANAALPVAGGTMTGDLVLDNQTDLRFGEATANGSNYVGFQAPASIASNVLWTLPATDAAVSGYALVSDAAGNLSWAAAGGGATGGTRNRIINGDFSVAQRGTSFVSGANNDDAYTLDRWYILSDGNDAIDVTQETSTVPTNQKYAIALDVETINKKFGIAQIIENVNCVGLTGGNVTLSFKAKVSSTTKLDNVKAAIIAWSGTADTVTSDIISAWGAEGTNPTLIANATYENTPANLSVTTSYATYSLSANIDTASTSNIIVFIWSDVTDTTLGDFLYVTDVQLEAGTVATPFERRSYGQELALCQRYFCKTFAQNVAPAQNTGSTATAVGAIAQVTGVSVTANWHFPVTMRTSATLTSFNPTAANANWSANPTSPVFTALNSGHQLASIYGTTNTIAGNGYFVHLTASAEL